jgi:hypothetical protein
MRHKLFHMLLILTLISLMSGCYSAGSFLSQNVTNVELSDPNFSYVATNLGGTSQAGYLIGISFSTGFMANTFALVRVDGTATLYDDAVQDLWEKYKEKNGDIEGKKLALVNIRYDTDILNLFVYTQTKLYIHADVVEFTE